MLPIFKEYRNMLNDNGIDLSEYDDNKLWIDRMIIKGFDKSGKERKICKLKVVGDYKNLRYEQTFYYKNKMVKGKKFKILDKPINNILETYEETYKRMEKQILDKERDSVESLRVKLNTYLKKGYRVILPTSMGKDSKLTEHLLKKITDNYIPIFNNTTLDSPDVYKEVKSRNDVKIITPTDKNGKNLSFYKLMKSWGTPNRFYRWCCSIFKEGATEQHFKGQDKLLFIFGMRNEESANRSGYGTLYRNIKWNNNTWIGLLPIRKWTELELWLYTIKNNIPINIKYKKGYARVGCNIACPFYTSSTWILDKYWYPLQYERYHNKIEEDFTTNEKWCRINCTKDEYHLNWNGGLVRKEPNDEVIDEFMKYKKFDNKELALQYFSKKCTSCKKSVYKKNEIAMNLKLFGRNIDKFLCKRCLSKQMGWKQKDWDEEVILFKQQNCSLF